MDFEADNHLQLQTIIPICLSCNLQAIFDKMEYVCNNCGRIIEEAAYDYSESFVKKSGKEIFENGGLPVNASSHMPSTVISSSRIGVENPFLRRLKFWQQRTGGLTSEQKNFNNFNIKLKHIVEMIMLSNNLEVMVQEFYYALAKKNLIKGKSTNNLLGSMIYLASKELDEPLIFSKLLRYLATERKKITAMSRLLKKNLNLQTKLLDVENRIELFVDPLGIYTINYAVLLEEFRALKALTYKELYEGKDPVTFAIIITYICLLKTHANEINLQKYTLNADISLSNFRLKLKQYMRLITEKDPNFFKL